MTEGDGQLALSDFVDAQRAYQKAVDLFPRSGQDRAELGLGHLCSGDADAAVEAYKKANELEPFSGDHHVGLARVYLQQRRFNQAEGEARKAIDIDPKSDQHLIWLGRVYGARGHSAKAIEQYGGAAALNPASGGNAATLAFAHLQNGDFAKASETFQQALDPYGEHGAPASAIAEVRYGLDGKAGYNQVGGQPALLILYAAHATPDDAAFAAEQTPVVYAGAWALARLVGPVDNPIVVALDPMGRELSSVLVRRERALWWTRGIIDDDAFAALWRITNQQAACNPGA